MSLLKQAQVKEFPKTTNKMRISLFNHKQLNLMLQLKINQLLVKVNLMYIWGLEENEFHNPLQS